MEKFFFGNRKSRTYFEGWYFKCQAKDGRILALIPAFHIDDHGRRSASLQVISEENSWWLEYAGHDFSASETKLQIHIGHCLFTDRGISLRLEDASLSLCGSLQFGPLSPLKSDIMGPFRFVPKMECSHGVLSMAHTLQGRLTLNGRVIDFSGGTGYLEKDRGSSFPSAYLWTQCIWQTERHNSLMLSIAAIPFLGQTFTGCICALLCQGREYRLATYLGAKVEEWSANGALVRQGKYRLEVTLFGNRAQPLHAPVSGAMGRIIHESLCAKVRYRFWSGTSLLLDHTDPRSSFEYAPSPAR